MRHGFRETTSRTAAAGDGDREVAVCGRTWRHAARLLRKHPSFLCLSALVLGLGIGLNTALFSLVYAILFKPLPVESPDDLVSIYQVLARQPDRPTVLNSLQYEHLKRHNEAFTDITAHVGLTCTLRANDETDAITAEWVMSNYFDVLGVRPLLGRTLVPSEDDVANPERAVIISHTLWTRRFQRDPKILGKQIHLVQVRRERENRWAWWWFGS